MSTIVVVKKGGIAVIGADTLTKAGSSLDSAKYVVNHEKIIQYGDSFIAIAGPTQFKLMLKDYFESHKERLKLDSVNQILRSWLKIHEGLKDKYFMNTSEGSSDSFESTQADVLIANRHGIFGVSSYRVVQEFSRFYAYGQGSDYAMGAIYALYDDPNKDAEALVRIGIEAAAEFDSSTGLPMTVYMVKQDTGS